MGRTLAAQIARKGVSTFAIELDHITGRSATQRAVFLVNAGPLSKGLSVEVI